MMDSLDFTSAIFVSSPYHLRRIKIMAGRVFTGKTYKLSFASPRFQKKEKILWGINKSDLKMIVSEYLKIVWFLIYEAFCRNRLYSLWQFISPV